MKTLDENVNFFLQKKFRSWNCAKKYIEKNLNGWVFRGQASSSWTLKTTIERISILHDRRLSIEDYERMMYHDFKKICRNYINIKPEDNVEFFSLMQHYGGTTRFLDFTKSFYIATFFACNNIFKDTNSTPAIWAIDYAKLIATMRDRYKLPKKSPSESVGSFNKILDDTLMYIMDKGVEGSFIMKGNYRRQIHDPGILCIEPSILNKRIEIQQGIFLVPLNLELSFEENLIKSFEPKNCKEFVIKIVLPKSLDIKKEILNDLQRMNINPKTLFQGLEGVMKNLNYNFLKKWEDVDDLYWKKRYFEND